MAEGDNNNVNRFVNQVDVEQAPRLSRTFKTN